MIVFDLRCGGGHVFEAWFGSTGDYHSQRERGLVACPICANTTIEKAAMAPRLSFGAGEDATVPVAMPAGPPAEVKSMLAAMAKLQAKMLEKSDWVGKRFATEARSMHFGEIEQRPIHGQATPREAAALVEDGIEVAPLPLPVTPPEAAN